MDMVKISGFAEKILQTPSFIKKLEDYELEELEIYIEKRKEWVYGLVSNVRLVPGQEWFTTSNVAEWADLERLATELRLEFQRRELKALPDNEFKLIDEEALEFRRDVIKRGKSYSDLWDEYRRAFGENDLPEDRFLVAEIDYCQTKIDELKGQVGSFERQLIALFKECIRRHKERLEELQMQPKEEQKPTELGRLEDMVIDAEAFLPRLWAELAKMPKPLVTKKGKYIWKGKNVSVLMALAQALKTGDKTLEQFETEDIYRALCRRFEQPEPDRPRIEGNTATGFTFAYTKHLAAFNEVLGNL